MKFILSLRDKENSLFSITKLMLMLIIILMPYGIKTLPNTLFFTFLIWFISLFWPTKIESLGFNKKKYYLLPAFAIITTLSITYSANYYIGAKVLERHISFIILPILFVTLKRRVTLKKDIVFFILGITLFLSLIVLIFRFRSIIGFDKITIFNNPIDIFKYTRYYIAQNNLTIHPSYFSYLIIIYLSYSLFSINKLKNTKYSHLLFTLLSIIALFFLQSRAALATLIVLLVYAVGRFLVKKKYILFSIVLLLSLSGSFLTYKYTRLGTTIKNLKANDSINKEDARIILWRNALSAIKEGPVFGYGVGDALDVLIEEHKKTGYKEGADRQLDAHNQFLETWLQSGIFGLISLILIFAIPLYQSIKKRQELLFLFLIISFIQLLFESMFIRLAGVVYFSFFYSYLYYVYYTEGGEWEMNKRLKITTSNSPSTN